MYSAVKAMLITPVLLRSHWHVLAVITVTQI